MARNLIEIAIAIDMSAGMNQFCKNNRRRRLLVATAAAGGIGADPALDPAHIYSSDTRLVIGEERKPA